MQRARKRQSEMQRARKRQSEMQSEMRRPLPVTCGPALWISFLCFSYMAALWITFLCMSPCTRGRSPEEGSSSNIPVGKRLFARSLVPARLRRPLPVGGGPALWISILCNFSWPPFGSRVYGFFHGRPLDPVLMFFLHCMCL
jgi:hypothetical protein